MKTLTNKQKVIGAVSVILTASCLAGVGIYETKQAAKQTEPTQTVKQKAQTASGSETHEKPTSPSSTKAQKQTQPTGTIDALGNEEFATMKRPTMDEITDAKKNNRQLAKQAIAQLEIPAIGCHMPILEGTTYQKMLVGATTLLPNTVIGKGNVALASHNMGVEHSMFTSIYQLQKGADIFLTNPDGQKFHYQVVSNDVVDFRNTEKLNLTKKPTVTLVTCQSVQTTDNRVVIQGELVG